ncbi:dihydrofolate reductase family protein [Alkaliphilus peptidifermentans]|uniref:Pyrimidine reductase, riboflavin biosynthesis n=1 Tax=Alkaliphilus peptidifermentans DSM 18978 TaxID=1120976 RepID=A0A1G5KR84_9FIRM|nr:dihydrofolate reductase family protein [Alkaliphilus peptidifermentans]SCZ03115.1 Pyrimidine reductase, riboflavin biosynthesis [Alkaliphilus peptidifermentans DSM 18978]
MDRPYIVVMVMTSADGRIAISSNITMWEEMDDSRTQTLGGTEIWKEVENKINFIYNPQADMLGSNSIVKEGEPLKELPTFKGDKSYLYQDFLPEEIVKRPNHKGWLVAVDGRGRLRSGYKGDESSGKYMLHLVSAGAPAEYLNFLQKNKIPYIISGKKQVDLKDAMKKLKNKLDISCLVTSAGGKLSGALLRAGMVDEVNIVLKPLLYGGFETPCLFDSEDLTADELPTKLQLITSTIEANGHVWLRYKVIHL